MFFVISSVPSKHPHCNECELNSETENSRKKDLGKYQSENKIMLHGGRWVFIEKWNNVKIDTLTLSYTIYSVRGKSPRKRVLKNAMNIRVMKNYVGDGEMMVLILSYCSVVFHAIKTVHKAIKHALVWPLHIKVHGLSSRFDDFTFFHKNKRPLQCLLHYCPVFILRNGVPSRE